VLKIANAGAKHDHLRHGKLRGGLVGVFAFVVGLLIGGDSGTRCNEHGRSD
jgi:hypothetical protein